MMQTFFRFVYRLILQGHPASFRARFGGEMEWIFEAECGQGRGARVLCDGVLSLLRQRLTAEDEPVAAAAGCAVLVSDLRISRVRFVQGAIASSLFFTGFALVLNQRGPLPVPFELRANKCLACSSHRQAPPMRIESLLSTLR